MATGGMDRRDFMMRTLAGGATAGIAGTFSAKALAQQADADAAAASKVPRRVLGKTGVTVPIILMGGSQAFDPKYDRLLHAGFNKGVDYIDTAEQYANGKSQIGVAAFQKQVGRDKVWITSKSAIAADRATPELYLTRLDDCLRSLETDYMDMYFMHMIKDERHLDPEFIAMGETIRKSGRAKFFGFSCHDGNVVELMEKAAKVGGIDAIMFRFNFRQYGDAALNRAIDNCVKAGIGLIAMKTQASIPDDQENVVEWQSKEFTLQQAKLKSVWADERFSASVSGMNNLEILEANTAAAMSPVQLSMSEFVQLNRLAALTAHLHCTGCNSICEAKIDGKVRIADALRYLMYHESYHEPETARALYNALAPIERDIDGIDFAAAEAACPQGIAITARLQKAREVLVA